MIRLLALVAFAFPASGYAQQQAVTAKSVHVRAGPAKDYPVVEVLSRGTPLTVEGCLSGSTWCDVILPDSNRGWIYAGNLNYEYGSDSVPILDYGSLIGLEIVLFSVGSYWDTYYHGRPWYRDRQQWVDYSMHQHSRAAPRANQITPPLAQTRTEHSLDHGSHLGQETRPAARSPGAGFAKPASRERGRR